MLTLQKEAMGGKGQVQESKAMQELKALQTQARTAMKKLRRIQENRLRWTSKDEKQQQLKVAPTASTASTSAASTASTIGSDSENDNIRFFHSK
jgi:hypothetical protein